MELGKRSRFACSLASAVLLALILLQLRSSGPALALAEPENWFVRPNGSGDACTQDAPCALQTALANAHDGDTLWLAAGAYTGTGTAVLVISRSVSLYGGWDGSAARPPLRNPALFVSSLDGEGQRRVVETAPGLTLTLDGLQVVRGASLERGGGLHAYNAQITLRDTTFDHNLATAAPNGDAYGGAASIEGGSLQVLSSTFRANAARYQRGRWSYGGGLYVSGTLTTGVVGSLFEANDAWIGSGLAFERASASPIEVRLCTFRDGGRGLSQADTIGGYGGGVDVADASAVLEGNAFIHNRVDENGGAIHARESRVTLDRNLMTGNQASYGAAVDLEYGTFFTLTNDIIVDNQPRRFVPVAAIHVESWSRGELLHNTLAHNLGSAGGYGLQIAPGSFVTLLNTILVSHTVGISVGAGSSAILKGTLWGAGVWANDRDTLGEGSVLTGTVNVYGDPAFVDASGGDYHIGPGSAAIDGGVDAGLGYDFDGEPRPRGVGYDIGADELGQPTPTPSATLIASPTAIATSTPTATPTATRSPTPTSMQTPTPTSTHTPVGALRWLYLPVVLRRA